MIATKALPSKRAKCRRLGRKTHKLAQKDRDACWTKKHGRSHFGYKNHIKIDAKHKLVRRNHVTDASVDDSRQLDGLLDRSNTSREVFADSAYRSAELQAKLRQRGFLSRIHTHTASSDWCGPKPKSGCRTLSTTSGGWHSWSAPPPLLTLQAGAFCFLVT
jgi:transposase, IS5 family